MNQFKGIGPDEYQNLTRTTAIYRDSIARVDNLKDAQRLLRISYAGLGLGEAGEIQGKIKKIIRDSGGYISPETQQAIKKELGDLMWYIAVVADEFMISLQEIMEENLDKLFDRQQRGVLGGSGDNR